MPTADRLVLAWALTTLSAAALFTLAPGIDLWVSGLFHRPGAGFPMATLPLTEDLRGWIWSASLWLVAIAAVGLVLARATGRPALWLPGRVWAFVLSLYLLGPVLIVNLLLKAHWGRARPAQITEFGGARAFTPALVPSDQCDANCSFVSGEGAAAVALAICLWVMLCHFRPGPRLARRAMAGLVALALVGTALRVMAGRHFLSDTVFAVLIVTGLALVLDRAILRRNRPGPVLTTPATPPIAPQTVGNRRDPGRLTD